MLQETSTVFKPKPEAERTQRKRGVRKAQIGFRVPEDLDLYIEAAVKGGYDKTEVVVKMLRTSMGAADALGPDWDLVADLAKAANITVGEMLGRLARIGLLQEKKAKK